ncbi:MAG: hypothetical protein WKF70_07575 [Chitinophagaceae bacterium]
MSHFITLQSAVGMTTAFRAARETVVKDEYRGQNILPIAETFDRSAFDTLLSQPGCTAIRLYSSMDAFLKIHTVAVAVNIRNEDILPSVVSGRLENDIVENSMRCPEECPPSSPLNI